MEDLWQVAWRTVVAVSIIIALTRINGLRSFSKMSSFDFAVTIAMGSILAGAITSISTDFVVYAAALVAVFVFQAFISNLRTRLSWPPKVTDNEPLLLMENGEIIEENLTRSKVTKADLYGKLREANATDISLVRAAVFEPTGDVSILHLHSADEPFSEELLEGVRR